MKTYCPAANHHNVWVTTHCACTTLAVVYGHRYIAILLTFFHFTYSVMINAKLAPYRYVPAICTERNLTHAKLINPYYTTYSDDMLTLQIVLRHLMNTCMLLQVLALFFMYRAIKCAVARLQDLVCNYHAAHSVLIVTAVAIHTRAAVKQIRLS